MSANHERDLDRAEASLSSLDSDARDVLAILAVCGGASLSAAQIGEIGEIGNLAGALAELERRDLVVCDGERYSLAPPERGRLQRLLATADAADRVLRAFIAIAEDGRLTLEDLDAVVELTGIAARLGRWRELLRLAEAARGTLSMRQRVGAWLEILAHEREAASVVGDDDRARRAEGERDRLRRRASTGPNQRQRVLRTALAASAAAAAGVGAGYLIGERSSDRAETVTEAGATTTVSGQGETVTETLTETVTTTTTVTVEPPSLE